MASQRAPGRASLDRDRIIRPCAYQDWLQGEREAIDREGGGLVEAYGENLTGRNVAGSFIDLGTVPMFDRRGYPMLRQMAMHRG